VSVFALADLEWLDDLARRISATEIMGRFQAANLSTRTKTGPIDLVSDADIAAEAELSKALTRRYAGVTVVGEEAAEADEDLVGELVSSAFVFVLDPVDGTLNFVSGVPLFAMIIAVAEHGRVIAGLIHDPVTGRSALALDRQGAWLKARDGSTTILRTATARQVVEMHGACSAHHALEPTRRERVAAASLRMRSVFNLRCAGHEHIQLSTGACDFLYYPGAVKPWDHAAGIFILRQAGGFAGIPEDEDSQGLSRSQDLLCASSEDAYFAIRDALA
jgi:fructose-1,6-bisphosphatase/inositol monophosphatase family enzyme